MKFRRNHLVVAITVLISMFSLSRGDVWILLNNLPGADISVGKMLVKSCQAQGLKTHELFPQDLNHQVLEKIQNDSLLILTDCGILPIESALVLDEYIQRGGKLISLGGTLFQKPVTLHDDKWLTKEEYLIKHAENLDSSQLIDFSEENLKYWIRSTNTANRKVSSEIIEDSHKGSCLHMSVDVVDDYELLFSDIIPEKKTPKGKQDFITFWAKGGAQTLRMSVIFEEINGSSWACEIPLTNKWKQYAISVKDFTQRKPARFQDAAPNEESKFLNTSKIKRFACGQIRRPDFSDFANHEFWITKIGFSKANQYEPKIWDLRFKHRDMLFPGYHAYSCSDVGKIVASSGQGQLISKAGFILPNHVRAFHPRCKSAGWSKSRPYRWIPLLEAFSPSGQYRGTVAALRFDREFKHVWAGFAIEDSDFYLHKNTADFIVGFVKRMLYGSFLWEGGSSQLTYFPEQDINLGASAIVKNSKQDMILKLKITGQDKQQEFLVKSTEKFPLRLNHFLGKAESFQKNSPYHVNVSLLTKEGIMVDNIEHNFEIWQPNKKLGWIKARNGEFYHDNKLWHPFGVNYMPSSGIAREPGDSHTFIHWFSNMAYDPDVIERDLSHIVDLGMNTICVFIYNEDIESWNFIDFLRRCESHNLRINLSFREIMPRLDFQASKVQELIEKNRLAEAPIIFLYDLAWEYRFQQGYYDFPDTIKDWNRWLVKKYSTLEKAIETWGYTPEMEIIDGLAVPPTHEQWYRSGEWNTMMEDFSDFLNTLLHDRFSSARNYIHSIDPHHLVSFRMQFSGDPTFICQPLVPYDLKGLANAVDVMEPEAYGRVGPWEKVRGGIFTNAYARAVAPELPVFWPEVGYSVWNPIAMTSSEKLQEEGAAYYRNFLRMLLESHANGVAFWWYPGGFRTIEKSDYGIINPDGTDRSVTKVIREFAPKIKNMGLVPVPKIWIDYPKDWIPGGIVGAYNQIKDEFWRNVDAGKVTGLKVE